MSTSKKNKPLPILATITLTIDEKTTHAKEEGMNPLYYLYVIRALWQKFDEKLEECPPTPDQQKALDMAVDMLFPTQEESDEADA